MVRSELLPSMIGSSHLVRSDPAVHTFTKELPWSHHQLYVNIFYVDGKAKTDTEAGDCAE